MSQARPSHQGLLVGRKAEMKAALTSLNRGKHVFVRGPYGIGKSTFAYALMEACGGPRLVVSVQDESPSEMADAIIRVLSTYQHGPRPERSSASSIYFHDRRTRIKSYRILKTLMEKYCVYRYPILVDDFRKVSTTKLASLNMLVRMGFRLILAIDTGYETKNIESLSKSCPVHTWIDLPRLTAEESKELVLDLFRQRNATPDLQQIGFWVKTYKGYPLQIVNHVREVLGR